MDVRVDASEVHRLAADLTALGPEVAAKARPVVLKGAVNVQRDARDLASGHRGLGAYPRSITFDLDDGGLSAEIGPDKELPQGPLGNIVEYGTSKNAPMPHLGPALDNEAPKFEEALADVASERVL